MDDMTACRCGDHSVIRLSNPPTGQRVRVRIPSEYARTLAAYDAGLLSGAIPATVRTLVDCLQATGAQIQVLTLTRGGNASRACLRLERDGAVNDVPVEPGVGLIIAKQLELEVLLAEADHVDAPEHTPPEVESERSTDVPDVYRSFLESLDLDAE